MAVDPVCGMTVDPARTPHHARHQKVEYHFCSAPCRERFELTPEAFLKPSAAPEPMEAAVYFCPMHPEVVSSHPGSLSQVRHGARTAGLTGDGR